MAIHFDRAQHSASAHNFASSGNQNLQHIERKPSSNDLKILGFANLMAVHGFGKRCFPSLFTIRVRRASKFFKLSTIAEHQSKSSGRLTNVYSSGITPTDMHKECSTDVMIPELTFIR